MRINFLVEYGLQPIREVAVQCPNCQNWFRAKDITSDGLMYKWELSRAQFVCPICEERFSVFPKWFDEYRDVGNEAHIEECDDNVSIYEGCLKRKEVWV